MYTRIFESILDSSLNVQSVPPSARWLWMVMLIIADRARTGVVDMPVERLAARAGLTVDQTNEGLTLLSAPDKDSRSEAEEGRRIAPIREDSTRGWRLVNYEDYAALIRAEQERERTRLRVAAFRDREKAKTGNTVTVSNDSYGKVTIPSEYVSDGADVSVVEESKTVRKKKSRSVTSDSEFNLVWTEYPSATGKAKALAAFGRTVVTLKDAVDIREALRRYKLHLKANQWKHPQNGSTWFNNWREWVDFIEPTGGGNGTGRSDHRGTGTSSVPSQPATTRQRFPARTGADFEREIAEAAARGDGITTSTGAQPASARQRILRAMPDPTPDGQKGAV